MNKSDENYIKIPRKTFKKSIKCLPIVLLGIFSHPEIALIDSAQGGY